MASVSEARTAQLFPTLTAAQIAVARRFASSAERSFAPGERLWEVGDRDVPAFLVVSGSTVSSRHGYTGAAH